LEPSTSPTRGCITFDSTQIQVVAAYFNLMNCDNWRVTGTLGSCGTAPGSTEACVVGFSKQVITGVMDHQDQVEVQDQVIIRINRCSSSSMDQKWSAGSSGSSGLTGANGSSGIRVEVQEHPGMLEHQGGGAGSSGSSGSSDQVDLIRICRIKWISSGLTGANGSSGSSGGAGTSGSAGSS
jgi:hypothetical protein